MRRRRAVVAFAAAASLLCVAETARAQEGAYMLILLDTSSSMLADVSWTLTYGDGSIRYPGIDTDGNRLADDSRLFIAKEVITEVVSAAGGIRFGLARYRADEFGNYGITAGNTSDVCPFYDGNQIPNAGAIDCGGESYPAVDFISANGWAERDTFGQCCRAPVVARVRSRDTGAWYWVDVCPDPCSGSDCNCYDYDDDGTCDHVEVDEFFGYDDDGDGYYDRFDLFGAAVETGVGADLLVRYSAATDYDPNDILEWVDHVETYSGGAYTNPEIRATGFTPLARAMMDLRDHFRDEVGGGVTPPPGTPGSPPCYRYAIVLTDGDDTCESTEASSRIVQAATRLADEGVDTYIIAFAIFDAALLGTLDAAASAGGTGFARRAGSRDELRAAFAEIVESAIRVEVCNNIDDDCDGEIDDIYRPCSTACEAGQEHCLAGAWGPCSARTPTTEVCDGVDNDCDGGVDEGLGGAPCGTGTGLCEPGLEECRGGTMVCVGSIGPAAEVCDGFDNDCDGSTDESDPIVDAPTSCGIDVGECHSGLFECVAGSLVCSGGDPSPELCDGLDNDCDGVADEALTRSCDYNVHCPGIEWCTAPFTWTGCTARSPTPELCNNADDDCDGDVDEGLTRPCETVCGTGTQVCVAGVWGACSAAAPVPEVCDALDNDCDGLVDEGVTRPCTSICGDGVEVCTDGVWGDCTAPLPSDEVCDGLDNDCDGDIDEDDPLVGTDCGSDIGLCEAGAWECIGGVLECRGGTGPTDEICDGLDNDCDGDVDEGLPLGEECDGGTGLGDTGQCEYGRYVCIDGALECEGVVGPSEEVCDCVDNDCDGHVDEGLGGDPCGTDVGECEIGYLSCVDCEMVCVGGIGPRPEVCDGFDNDCDGLVDEEGGDALCPEDEARCIEGQCALPCGEGEFPCPPGKTCVDGYCVGDLCSGVVCDECERCNPSTGACESLCAGRTCPDGLVCYCGRCVEDNCYYLGCPEDDQLCLDFECVDDPCAGVACPDGQFCRGGDCHPICTPDIECGDGQSCFDGECVDDPCAGVTCPAGEMCDPTDGTCSDECQGVVCPPGRVCDPSSGACVDDPCTGVRCPAGSHCERGTCVAEAGGGDAGADGGTYVLATGAGGCACRAVAGPAGGIPPLILLGLPSLLALLGLRRRTGGGR